MEVNKIKRPIVIITLGAICGILLGQELKLAIIFYVLILCFILLQFIIARNNNLKNFCVKISDAVFHNTNKRLNNVFKECVEAKLHFRPTNEIPQIIIVFFISVITFHTYTIILNNKYESFYNKVQENIETEAVIISNCKENEYYNSYRVKGKNGEFKNKKFILYAPKAKELEYGDKVKITGEFSKPNESRNYKGFNYKKYLQTEKIYGTIKAESVEVKSKNNTMLIFRLSNRASNKIIEQIKKLMPEKTGGLLIGMMLGSKDYISDDVRLDFQRSSLAHILAVSGAHVSYIILGLNYLITMWKMPKKSGYLVTIFILIAFIFLTNFYVSVIRACTMTIILIISRLFYRKTDIQNTIAISVLIILIFNPYSINSVSMQLSYLGTIGVIFGTPAVSKILEKFIPKKLSKIISVPIAAQITILPIMLRNFNTISLTFLFSNIIAMPMLGICIIAGYLLVIISFVWFGLAQKIGFILALFLKILISIAHFFGSLTISNIYVVTPTNLTIAIYYAVIFALIYFKKIPKKQVIITVLIIILIIEIPYSNYNGKLKIYFIDVGQRGQHFDN